MKFLKCIESTKNSYSPKSNVAVKRIKKSRGRRSSSSSIGGRRKRNSYIASSLNRSVYPDEYFPQQPPSQPQQLRNFSSQELIDQFHSGVGTKRRVKSQPEIRVEYDRDNNHLLAMGPSAPIYNKLNNNYGNGGSGNRFQQRQNQIYHTQSQSNTTQIPRNLTAISFQKYDNRENDIENLSLTNDAMEMNGMRRSISVSGGMPINTGLSVLPLTQSQSVNQIYKQQQSLNTPIFQAKDFNNNNGFNASNWYEINPQLQPTNDLQSQQIQNYQSFNNQMTRQPRFTSTPMPPMHYVVKEIPVPTPRPSLPPPPPPSSANTGDYNLQSTFSTTLPAKTLYQQALMHPRVQQLQRDSNISYQSSHNTGNNNYLNQMAVFGNSTIQIPSVYVSNQTKTDRHLRRSSGKLKVCS